MNKFDSKGHLFVYDERKWKNICEKDYCIPEPPSVTEVDNGVILPLKKRKDVRPLVTALEGGYVTAAEILLLV